MQRRREYEAIQIPSTLCEIIYQLSKTCHDVRISDIAKTLNLSKASVSLAITKLAKWGLVHKDVERHIHLTKIGEYEAMQILYKYEAIRRFLAEILGVDKEVGDMTLARWSNVVSTDTLRAMCRFASESVNKRERTSYYHMRLEPQNNYQYSVTFTELLF